MPCQTMYLLCQRYVHVDFSLFDKKFNVTIKCWFEDLLETLQKIYIKGRKKVINLRFFQEQFFDLNLTVKKSYKFWIV